MILWFSRLFLVVTMSQGGSSACGKNGIKVEEELGTYNLTCPCLGHSGYSSNAIVTERTSTWGTQFPYRRCSVTASPVHLLSNQFAQWNRFSFWKGEKNHLLTWDLWESSCPYSLKTTALVAKAPIILSWHGMWVAGTHGRGVGRGVEYATLCWAALLCFPHSLKS